MINKHFLKKWLIGLIICTITCTYIPFENFVVKAKSSQTKKEEQKRTELTELRTDTSKTFLNNDGTQTTEITQNPIHYKEKSGNWEEIDNTLIESNNEDYLENKANSFSIKVKKATTEEKNIQIIDSDKAISYGLDSVLLKDKEAEIKEKTKGVVDENTIVYSDVLEGVSLKYAIGSDRIKEDIIYKEKPAEGFPERFTYKLDLEGLEIKKEGDKIYLYDLQTKEKLYYIEAPYMYDAYIPKGFKSNKEMVSIPEQAISSDIKLDYKELDGQLFIYLMPNQEWLNDDNRIYPITIDPTIVRINGSNLVEDTNLRSAYPTQTGGNDTELGTGLYKDATSTNVIRTLLKFDVSAIPQNVIVTNADLNMWMSSVYKDTPITINAHQVTSSWEENQASWNLRKTLPQTAWNSKGGDYSSTVLDSVSGIGTLLDLSFNLKWSMPSSLINNWIANPGSNNGILLKSTSEATNTYKKFISSEHPIGSQYQPLLVVTYKTSARLGLEDYWQYDTHPLNEGTSYVNLTTSNNVIQYEDFQLLGRGNSSLTFSRTYNSKDLEKSALGYGWTFTGNEKLFISGKDIQYYDEDGTTHVFTYDPGSATYLSGSGVYQTIKNSSQNTYTLYDQDGTTTTFKVAKPVLDTSVNVAMIQMKVDRNGNKTNYSYDSNNRLIRIATDLGISLSKYMNIQYNTKNLISKISYDDKEFSLRYTSSDYLEYVDQLRTNTGEKTTTQFVYKDKRIATVIDPNGRKTDFTYDNGNLVKLQEPLEVNGVKDPLDRPGTKYTLNIPMKSSTVTDPEGNTTLYKVNDNYVIERITSPSGIVTEYGLDANYNVITEKEIENGVTKILQTNKYDGNGNLLSTTDAEGNVRTYTYAPFGNIATQVDSNQKKSTYKYDANGNLIESIVPMNVSDFLTTTYTYNSFGDLLSMESSDGIKETMVIDYTSAIKTITHRDPHGNLKETKSDLSGNVISTKDGKFRETNFSYNLKNELVKVTDAKNYSTNYSYDKNGNILSILNAAGEKTNYQYNGQNLIEKETNALGKTTSYKYDTNGSLTEVVKPNGDKIDYKQDELTESGMVIANGKVKWRFEKNGDNQIIYDDYNSPKTIAYYDNGLIKSISPDSRGILTSYTYQGEDYVSSISFPAYKGWNQLEFGKSDSYQTTEINLNKVKLATLDYNNSGQPVSVLFNNETKAIKEYDRSRLSKEILELPAGKQFDSFQYNYDANHFITSITSDKGTTKYEYDELNQLVKETFPDGTVVSYAYDKVGNRVEKQTQKGGQITNVTSCNRQVVLNSFCSLSLNTFCFKNCSPIFNSITFSI